MIVTTKIFEEIKKINTNQFDSLELEQIISNY